MPHISFISVPIGNPKDITLRSLETLRDSDLIVLENIKIGIRNLKSLGIDNFSEKIATLNQNTDPSQLSLLVKKIEKCKKVAITSDNGSPLIDDPAYRLLNIFRRKENIKKYSVEIQPGPSSPLLALCYSGFSLSTFYYAGFLPRQRDERREALLRLKKMPTSIAIMDTPYRLMPLLEDVKDVLGPSVKSALCKNMTMDDQEILLGTISHIIKAQNDYRPPKTNASEKNQLTTAEDNDEEEDDNEEDEEKNAKNIAKDESAETPNPQEKNSQSKKLFVLVIDTRKGTVRSQNKKRLIFKKNIRKNPHLKNSHKNFHLRKTPNG